MDIGNLIDPDWVVFSQQAKYKKQLLEEVAEFASKKTGIPVPDVFQTLTERERLGSTGFGSGVAIPHGKLKKLEHVFLGLMVLNEPVEYDAPDGEPVDIVFVLLVPEEGSADHLKLLACVARVSRNPDMLQRIRASKDPRAIYKIISEVPDSDAA